MSDIFHKLTSSNARNHQDDFKAFLRSAAASYGKHRQTPYNYPPANSPANESFVRTRNSYSSNNAGHHHLLVSRADTESVAPTTSSQSQQVYSQPFTNEYLGPIHFLRGSNAGSDPAPYLPYGGHTHFPNPVSQSGRSSPLINLLANHPLWPDDHGVEEEDDDDSLSDNTNRRDTFNEGVECVDLVSDSSANGGEDIEENDKENEHEGVMSNSSINEEKDIATLEDSKTEEAISTLTENLKSLYLRKVNTDVTIKVKNKEFTAHKVILNARLEYFASMFEHNFSENKAGIVEITDCDPESFEDFLLFLYTADLKIVSSQNVIGLYKTSEKYGCKELLEKCVRYMIRELSVDTFCDYFQIATLHNESDLLEAIVKFFIKNAKQIFLTTKWLTHMEEHPSLCNELLIKYSNADNSCRK